MATLTMAVVGLVLNWAAISGTGSQPAISPDDSAQAQVLSDAGWQLWQQRKFADAEAKFEEAVGLNSKLDNAWNGLGWSQFNQGKSEEAIKAFRKCVKLTSQHGAALNGLGQAHFALGKHDAAERYFLKAKDAPAAHFGLVRLYVKQGKFKKAQKWVGKIEATAGPEERELLKPYKAAINKGQPVTGAPKEQVDVQAATQEGWQLFFKGQNEKAEASFKEALKENPNHLPAINGHAFSLLNQGKATQAKPMFERLLKEEPKHFGAMNGLARCLKAEGKTDDAIKVWTDMQDQSPGVNAATSGLAMTYFELEKYAEAIPYLEKLAEANSNPGIDKMLKQAREKSK